KVVVIVLCIFRTGIPLQKFEDALLLLRGKIQYLFVHIAVLLDIMPHKVPVIGYIELIDHIPPGEVEIKVGLIEIKNSVIVDIVPPILRVPDAKGIVSEGGIQFTLVWTAGYNTYFCSFGKGLSLCKSERDQPQENKYQRFPHNFYSPQSYYFT